MPPLSTYFVRLALANLAVGITAGAFMLANKGVPFAAWLWRLRSAHIELLLVGWLMQLAMGVVFWIAPRFWLPPARGNVTGARLALFLLNAGVWTVVTSTYFGMRAEFVFAGRLLELSAAVAFTLHLWPRIVSREG